MNRKDHRWMKILFLAAKIKLEYFSRIFGRNDRLGVTIS